MLMSWADQASEENDEIDCDALLLTGNKAMAQWRLWVWVIFPIIIIIIIIK